MSLDLSDCSSVCQTFREDAVKRPVNDFAPNFCVCVIKERGIYDNASFRVVHRDITDEDSPGVGKQPLNFDGGLAKF